jgi:hypothetical protein
VLTGALVRNLRLDRFVNVMDATFASWNDARHDPIALNPSVTLTYWRHFAFLIDAWRTARRTAYFLRYGSDDKKGQGQSGKVGDAADLPCSIFIFFESVRDVLAADGGASFVDGSGQDLTTLVRRSKAHPALRLLVSSIEVLRDDRIERCYFRVPECCRGLRAVIRDRVIEEVERDNGDAARVKDFFERCFYVMREIDVYYYMRCHRVLNVLYVCAPILDVIAQSLAVAISLLLLLINYRYVVGANPSPFSPDSHSILVVVPRSRHGAGCRPSRPVHSLRLHFAPQDHCGALAAACPAFRV